MITIELRSLISGENKKIEISHEIENVFNLWKNKVNKEPEPLEIFYAGYVLSNPMVREKLIESGN